MDVLLELPQRKAVGLPLRSKPKRASSGASFKPSQRSYQGILHISTESPWPGNQDSDRALQRASTGTLHSSHHDPNRAPQRASTGAISPRNKAIAHSQLRSYRASTGGLKNEKSASKRNTHHHILAGALSEQPRSPQERSGPKLCNRCEGRIRSQFFQCRDCRDYLLCTECGEGGIYCQYDAHSWFEMSTYWHSKNSQIIGEITPEDARTLYFGTRTFPSIFRPPCLLDVPETLFMHEHRFIRKSDPREILIFADGACLRTSKGDEAVAGWAFVYRPSAYSQDGALTHAGTISGRLEIKGPTGRINPITSNRAELRAAVAALQFLDWSMDCNRGWRSIVIATDSEYVTCSITKWISDWEDSQWKLENHNDVNNKDLWKILLHEVRRYHADGVKISFWRVPRHCNTRAYEFARKATGRGYKERTEMVVFQADGPVKVRVTPFIPPREKMANGQIQIRR
ncbi:BgTH12-01673 [Blumeria graminis f. sp. triticale]|uniref:ribonuclease H n=3 Tax=Blumeria graminis TaxID=34373 RepID=A0A9X9MF45_BLUGR|nr:hypothetical protein BGT96224_A20901 [Blumeria graminis f. sp. tritici 96224]CAD6501421.1 BgTH12-01673 [Blumeria graminis f. sp. triticale]VDB83914.1 BgtA-20901 [Blumeria graminis f. sp. tritici]